MSAKIALGSVQFGLAYGIANSEGQVSQATAADILSEAAMHGIDTIDTAIAYGESEEVLGNIGVNEWQIVSKLPAMPPDCSDVEVWVEAQVADSLQRLRVSRLYGLLLHRPEQLLEARGDRLFAALRALQARGVVLKIGVSVYEPAELDRLASCVPFELVQVPFNLLDTRMATSGWLARLQESGCEIHARSIFLQGLLLMPSSARPEKFSRWQGLWQTWDSWLASAQLTPLQACLRFALAQPEIDKLVLGVNSVAQLREILEASVGNVPTLPPTLRSADPVLLNPALWGQA